MPAQAVLNAEAFVDEAKRFRPGVAEDRAR